LLSRGLFSSLDASSPFFIAISLKYVNNKSLISRIVQISRPSFRPHLTFRKIRKRYGANSLVVISTKKGLQMKEFLFTNRIGGLVLFEMFF
jgi:ribosomal protein S8